jgi:hypothetical protein
LGGGSVDVVRDAAAGKAPLLADLGAEFVSVLSHGHLGEVEQSGDRRYVQKLLLILLLHDLLPPILTRLRVILANVG